MEKQASKLDQIINILGDRLKVDAQLAPYTAARVGGKAHYLMIVESQDELRKVATLLWISGERFMVIGGGSNVLVSDSGFRGGVIINKARHVSFDLESPNPVVRAESGANFGLIARQTARRGYSGLEWAAGVPGTVGGAVIGNAGAFDSDVDRSIIMAIILQHSGANISDITTSQWRREDLGYSYRSSILKKMNTLSFNDKGFPSAIILEACFSLEEKETSVVQENMTDFSKYRQKTQPPGASMGSIFKNPPGDHAGRLMEEAGLKGKRIGGAEISNLHANFFINAGNAKALDIYRLINYSHNEVMEKTGVDLDLEIELIGEWD